MNAEYRRMSCHIHVMTRAAQRGLVFTADDIVRVEELLDRARPAFERPDTARYRLTVKSAAGRRVRVIYDVQLRCLVSVMQANRRKRRDGA